MAYNRNQILQRSDLYDGYAGRWEYYIRSFLGGEEYKGGRYLQEYNLELENEFEKRLQFTPLDNHCRNIVHIYSSFLFRVPATRKLESLNDDPSTQMFLDDADLEGRSFDALLREVQQYASIYGHCWLILDKPNSNVRTRAEELQQEIRPYINIFTPENVMEWQYERAASGKYYLSYLKVRENRSKEKDTFRLWYLDRIDTVEIQRMGARDP